MPEQLFPKPPDWAVKAAAKIWDKLFGTKPFEPLDVVPMAEIIATCFLKEHSTVLTAHLETTDDSRYFAGLAMQFVLQMGGVEALEAFGSCTREEADLKMRSIAKVAWAIADYMEIYRKGQNKQSAEENK